MTITDFKTIGRKTYQFSVEGENLHDCVKALNNLSFTDVERCQCGSDNLELRHRKTPKGNYTFVKCWDCKRERNFGQRRDNPNTFYLKKDWNLHE